MEPKGNGFKWLVWSLAALFYFYEYLIRVAPSVMVESLMQSFQVNAEAIGVIAAFYFYAYAPMQLVAGVMLDRFGARLLLGLCSLVGGLAVIGFGLSTHLIEAKIARFFVGLGSSFAFVGMLYLTSHWFPLKTRGTLIGLANSIAMIGAFAGEGPVSLADDRIGWRHTLVILGAAGLVLSFCLLLTARHKPPFPETKEKVGNLKEALGNLKNIAREPMSWLNAIAAFFFYATTLGMGSLWGVPFLKSVYNLSTDQAGFANSMIYLGWMVGGPLVGYLSDKIHRRKTIILLCALLGGLAISLIVFFPVKSVAWVFSLLLLVGFFSSAQLLNYSFAIDQHPIHATGSAVAFTNFVITSGAIFLQPFIGYLLDLFWDGAKQGGVPFYSAHTYQIAMIFFPLSFALCFLLSLFLKEKSPYRVA